MALGCIAIIGWGSLIWDLENLAPQTSGDWQMQAGPALPMEFSRISPKRKMGLVVCLDPDAGVSCATHFIASKRTDIELAIEDLAKRERAPLGRIGAVHVSGLRKGRMPEVCEIVADWCRASGHAGAVWTDLEPNFCDHTGREFTLGRGLEYLQTLEGDSLQEAYRYISNAPPQTDTPMRALLRANTWWQGLACLYDKQS